MSLRLGERNAHTMSITIIIEPGGKGIIVTSLL